MGVVRDGAIRALCGTPLSSAVRPSNTIPAGKHLCLECREAGRDPAGVPTKPRQPHLSAGAQLYPWQQAALEAWREHGNRGVIEAVTGSGKTRIAVVAIDEHVRAGGSAAVIVPTIELQRQWWKQLRKYVPYAQFGLLGDGGHASLQTHEVVIATAQSAARRELQPAGAPSRSLLVADECHRYGAAQWANVLGNRFGNRLGLTATYEREDSGVEEALDPYFGGVCYRLDYQGALRDGAICRFKIAFAGVMFDSGERTAFAEHDERASHFKSVLHNQYGLPREPFGDFILAANRLANDGDAYAAGAARSYLFHFARRRELLAGASGKMTRIREIAAAFRRAERSIIFSQTRAAAAAAIRQLRDAGLNGAVLDSTMASWERQQILSDFEGDRFEVVAAPKLLDEGIDVPAADLAAILATSRSRRQMVQRMGRVLRRKEDGRIARIVVFFVEDTIEDPSRGSHEDFFDLILPAAEEVRRFSSSPEEIAKLIEFLSEYGGTAA